jgi:hypothetical protein
MHVYMWKTRLNVFGDQQFGMNDWETFVSVVNWTVLV